MSQAQAFANHSLYMASIMLDSWRSAAQLGQLPNPVIDAAYGPSVRLHLLDAYGWQLLACNRSVGLPRTPPHSSHALPALAPGIEISPEVREMALLEREGWLALLQNPIAPGFPASRSKQILAVSSECFDCAGAEHIYHQLESLMSRVAGAIEES